MKITRVDLFVWVMFFALGWVLCAGTEKTWLMHTELQKYRAQTRWYDAQIKALLKGVEPHTAQKIH